VPKHLKPALLAHLLRDASMEMVLVFSRTKHGAERIAKALEREGIKTATLHSNRSQNQRIRSLKEFKSGAVRVLVATDIAARGIDVDGISHVVNFDFPMHSEDYVHRIGRTGRAHRIGDAISFVSPEDHSALRSLERFIGQGIVRKRAEGFDVSRPAPQSTGGGESGERRRGTRELPRSGRDKSSRGREEHAGGGRSDERSKGGGQRRNDGGRGKGEKGKSVPSVRGVPGGMTWSPRRG
jgi:ATP-dependent RNA helicase RhlE